MKTILAIALLVAMSTVPSVLAAPMGGNPYPGANEIAPPLIMQTEWMDVDMGLPGLSDVGAMIADFVQNNEEGYPGFSGLNQQLGELPGAASEAPGFKGPS